MKYLLLLAAILGFVAFAMAGDDNPCKFKDESNGKKYDVTKLSESDYQTSPEDNEDRYTFTFRVCNSINSHCRADAPSNIAAAQFQQSACLAYTGLFNSNTTFASLDPEDPKLGVKIVYKDGQDGSQGMRQTELHLYCGEEFKAPVFKGEDKPDTSDIGYIYTIEMTSPHACPLSGGGISVGSILLILFFSGIALYIPIGIAVEIFVYKTEGWKRFVPNANFWLDLPFLVKDGFMFPIQLVLAATGKSSSYQTV